MRFISMKTNNNTKRKKTKVGEKRKILLQKLTVQVSQNERSSLPLRSTVHGASDLHRKQKNLFGRFLYTFLN